MVAPSTEITYAAMQSLNTATLSGSYLPLGSKIPAEARIVKVVNNSNVDLTVSIDGTTDHDIIPSTTFFLYDLGTNRGNASASLTLPKNVQFYVKGSAGTGSVYLVVLFGTTGSQTTFL